MKLIKVSHIALAVAATLTAGVAHSAAPVAAKTVWSSGASAPTKAQFLAFKSNCVGGAADVYMSTSAGLTGASLPGDTGTGNFFAYQCTFNPAEIATPDAAVYGVGTTKTTLFHTVDGGSFNAFAPHLPPNRSNTTPNPNKITTLARITTVAVTSECTTLPKVPATNPVTVHVGCATGVPGAGDVTAPIPDGGFSDVEDEMWPKLTLGTNFITASANVGQLFGVAVTDALYLAMQSKQFAESLLPGCGALGSFTVGPCQPSISADQYRSIISTGTAGSPWQTDWQPLVGAAGLNHVVNLCRRVPTSGTQASSDIFFLENPCRQWPTLAGLLDPQVSTASNANYIVTHGSGTGNVKTCLNNSNNNANVNNKFAIGVMSMENIPAVSDKFKFVKIGGVSGNVDLRQRAAGAKGTYPFVMEMVYTVQNPDNRIVANPPLPPLPPTAARQGFFDELAGDLGNPVNLDLAGLFILPTSPNAGTPNGDDVGFGTKLGNNCQPQQLFF